jgi:hypothetical protein
MLVDGGGRSVLDEGGDLAHRVAWWFSGGGAVVPGFALGPGGGGGGIPGVPGRAARGHAGRECECL